MYNHIKSFPFTYFPFHKHQWNHWNFRSHEYTFTHTHSHGNVEFSNSPSIFFSLNFRKFLDFPCRTLCQIIFSFGNFPSTAWRRRTNVSSRVTRKYVFNFSAFNCSIIDELLNKLVARLCTPQRWTRKIYILFASFRNVALHCIDWWHHFLQEWKNSFHSSVHFRGSPNVVITVPNALIDDVSIFWGPKSSSAIPIYPNNYLTTTSRPYLLLHKFFFHLVHPEFSSLKNHR